MPTPLEIKDWVESTRPTDWYGKCAGLTDRVVAAFTGGSRQWYDSATDARNSSGWLNPDAGKCPPGGIHYWSYCGTAWDGSRGDWGHVTIDIYGGGGSTLSATGFAYENWGVRAGLISVESQSRRAGMKYLGWAPTYGNASPLIIRLPGPSDNSTHPFDSEAEEMALTDETKNWFLEQFDDIRRIASPYKIYEWGTGLIVVNPKNGRVWVLPGGYAELLSHLGLASGPAKVISDPQLNFVTQVFPSLAGDFVPAETGISKQDIQGLKEAIERGGIPLSPEQYESLVTAVTEGARTGGEAGAKKAVENISFVVKSN